MELETMHDREFYEAKAEEYPLLERILTGKVTFRGTLERLVDKINNDYRSTNGVFKQAPIGWLIYKMGDYFTRVLDLAPYKLDRNILEKNKNNNRTTEYIMASGFAAILVAATSLFLPPAGALFAVSGGSLGTFKGGLSLAERKMRKDCEKFLSPFYLAAESLDADIGRCFMLEHYSNARPRFEQTYLSLEPEDERKVVNAQLQSYLRAGGMKGMDELQLNDYLSGLLTPQVGGDA